MAFVPSPIRIARRTNHVISQRHRTDARNNHNFEHEILLQCRQQGVVTIEAFCMHSGFASRLLTDPPISHEVWSPWKFLIITLKLREGVNQELETTC